MSQMLDAGAISLPGAVGELVEQAVDLVVLEFDVDLVMRAAGGAGSQDVIVEFAADGVSSGGGHVGPL
jgi:hypothetical protein